MTFAREQWRSTTAIANMLVPFGTVIITLPSSFFQTYLIPQARKSAGITEEQVSIHDASLSVLIKSYCRESGVRNLQKHVEKVIIHEEQM